MVRTTSVQRPAPLPSGLLHPWEELFLSRRNNLSMPSPLLSSVSPTRGCQTSLQDPDIPVPTFTCLLLSIQDPRSTWWSSRTALRLRTKSQGLPGSGQALGSLSSPTSMCVAMVTSATMHTALRSLGTYPHPQVPRGERMAEEDGRGGIVIRKGRGCEIEMATWGYSFVDTQLPGSIPPLTVILSFSPLPVHSASFSSHPLLPASCLRALLPAFYTVLDP